jgi:DeoR/GlpR family transcriptional regulator of sugar metabolism
MHFHVFVFVIAQFFIGLVYNDVHMLTLQRKKLILQRLASDGQIIAKALATELGVSEDSIRRDLRELAQENKLQRVHGGALPASAAVAPLAVRQEISPNDKQNLGRVGAAMVKAGQVIVLDGGSTALQIARHLPFDLRATVITHSPTVAVELAVKPHLEIIMLGGRLYRHSMVNVGATTIAAMAKIRADVYFMGVTGVHAQAGLTTGDFEEAAVKLALHENSAETVVLASPEKLGAASAFTIAPLNAIATLVVPSLTPLKTQRLYSATGVNVVLAD